MLNISGIDNGYVIDHIKAGKSMDIYNYLKLGQLDCQVAIIKNASSSKMGKKDIIKVQGEMNLDLDILGFVDNHITVNVIRDGKIVEKKNPRRITSVERGLPQIFRLTDRHTKTYRCIYCEEKFSSK